MSDEAPYAWHWIWEEEDIDVFERTDPSTRVASQIERSSGYLEIVWWEEEP